MDTIGDIISTFTSDDIKAFRGFANRQKKLRTRKDLDLFNLLIKQPNIKAREAVAKLYPDDLNTDAYHAVRKKLLRQIMNYLVLKQFDEDTSSVPSIMGMIGLARYLFTHGKEKQAWNYLIKAEELAQSTDQFDQLRLIYTMQIEHCTCDCAPALEEIMTKYKNNKILADQNERAVIALGIIRQQLKITRLEGKDIDFDYLISNVITEYELHNAFLTQAKLLYQVISIFRSANIVKKEYLPFEPFVLSNYERFNTETGFKPKDLEYKIGLLYIIAHTLYRNKKFDESLKYLQQLQDCLNESDKTLAMQYLDKTTMLQAANLFFTNQIDLSIEILEQTRQQKKLLKPASELSICLNISIYQIYSNSASKACKTLMSIEQSSAYCKKMMGEEWVLKRDLTEVIVQYELGNDDVALNGLKSIERSHNELMQQDRYNRVFVFISLIRELILHPELATTKDFFDKVESSFAWLPVEQEDLHAVLFYAWFKSKVIGQESYQTLRRMLMIE